jgi:diphthine-ammonia ligase
MKNIALSWSGGKDACMALHSLIESGYHVAFLVTTLPKELDQRTFGHGEKKISIELQSQALNIPVEFIECTFHTYTENFTEQLAVLKDKYGLDAVAFGDLYLEEHRSWGEKVCAELGLKAMYPLWIKQEDALNQLKRFTDSGYKAKVIRIMDEKLSSSWLGRELDKKFYQNIQETNICPMGEGGEYHTFVYGGPLFGKELELKLGEIIQLETTKRLELSVVN